MSTSPAKKQNEGKKIILVTGGTGLVGKGIQEALETRSLSKRMPNEEWVFLSSKDCNLLSMEDTRRLFERVKPTHVIHLAAKVGGLYANSSQKVEFYRENTLINDHIMECCKDFKVEKLLSCLSTCIFPDKVEYPLTEEKVHLGPPHASNEGYALAKRMIDTMNRCYNEEYGCNFTSIIPTNVYGKYDNFNIEQGHVLPGMLHKVYLAKKNKAPFTVWGTGKPLRQFIYNVDLGELMVWALRNYNEISPIILSVGEEDEVSIKQAAEAVVKGMKFAGEVVYDTSKADGQYRKVASNAKLRKYLPDYKFTSIEDGLKETCEWFEANYETSRH
jgi:GDP-L-fucose synthase